MGFPKLTHLNNTHGGLPCEVFELRVDEDLLGMTTVAGCPLLCRMISKSALTWTFCNLLRKAFSKKMTRKYGDFSQVISVNRKAT